MWKDLTINAQTLHYPEVHGQLVALDTDLQILKGAKKSMLTYWEQVTANMDLYLSMSNGREHERIHKLDVERIAQRTEWVSFLKWENGNFFRVNFTDGLG